MISSVFARVFTVLISFGLTSNVVAATIDLEAVGGPNFPPNSVSTTLNVKLVDGGVPTKITIARNGVVFANYPSESSFKLSSDKKTVSRPWCISNSCFGNQAGAHTLTAVAIYSNGSKATKSITVNAMYVAPPNIAVEVQGGPYFPPNSTNTNLYVRLLEGGVPSKVTIARNGSVFATYPGDSNFVLSSDKKTLTRSWCISNSCFGNQAGAHTLTFVATYSNGTKITKTETIYAMTQPQINLVAEGGPNFPPNSTATNLIVSLEKGGVPSQVTIARNGAVFATYPGDSKFTLSSDQKTLTRSWCISNECFGNQAGAHTLTATATYPGGLTATKTITVNAMVVPYAISLEAAGGPDFPVNSTSTTLKVNLLQGGVPSQVTIARNGAVFATYPTDSNMVLSSDQKTLNRSWCITNACFGNQAGAHTLTAKATYAGGQTVESEIVVNAMVGSGGGGGGGDSDVYPPQNPVSYLPVIPGARGYGMATKAGRGGKVYRITNLNDSGSGSLRECVEASNPRVCVFEISGAITLSKHMVVRQPYLTIAGQTAPSPGIMLRGAGLFINSHDVLVQHIAVRPGDSSSGPAPENRDAMAISTNGASTYNVVVDHVSLSWSIDEILSVWSDTNQIYDVTIRNSIFAQALLNSLHPKGPHSMGVLIGRNSTRVDLTGNIMAFNKYRNPLIRDSVTDVAVVNNLIYCPGSDHRGKIDYGDKSSKDTPFRGSTVSNITVLGPASGKNSISVVAGTPTSFKLFLEDNIGPNSSNDPWTTVRSERDIASVRAPSAVVWPTGLVPLYASSVRDYTLKHAGTRPKDRDPVDTRVINHIKAGTGSIVDTVSQAGGYPSMSVNRRTLNLPSNPNGDDDGDGYTNLEEYLHEMARQVEW